MIIGLDCDFTSTGICILHGGEVYFAKAIPSKTEQYEFSFYNKVIWTANHILKTLDEAIRSIVPDFGNEVVHLFSIEHPLIASRFQASSLSSLFVYLVSKIQTLYPTTPILSMGPNYMRQVVSHVSLRSFTPSGKRSNKADSVNFALEFLASHSKDVFITNHKLQKLNNDCAEALVHALFALHCQNSTHPLLTTLSPKIKDCMLRNLRAARTAQSKNFISYEIPDF